MNLKLFKLLIIILVFISGFIIGVAYGIDKAISWCVDTGIKILKIGGINISETEQKIMRLVWNYKNNVNSCFQEIE